MERNPPAPSGSACQNSRSSGRRRERESARARGELGVAVSVIKIRRAFGPWRCEIPTFAFDKPIYSFNLPRASRGRATRGPMPPACALADPGFGAKDGPKANDHRFVGPPGASQKTIHFRTPSKSTPGGGKVDPCWPWAANGSIFHSFGIHFGSHFTSYFFILFQTPQNLDFALPYCTFASFKHPKSSHFETPFHSLFRPHFGTPFGRAFWPTLAPQGADLASPCRF